jgi:peroxiredoxin (alkyl hydroperoxide reductase subunit C)
MPVDDGAAAHLLGGSLPTLSLAATDGRSVRLDQVSRPTIVYAYPRTGRPGEPPLVEDWDLIPGARGCTPESCGFRDHHAEIAALGVDVFGLSTQTTEYQREAVDRLGLPFPLLSDADLALTTACRLPAMELGGQTLLRRQTWLIRDGRIAHLWYPVFPPDTHATEVLDWLRRYTR